MSTQASYLIQDIKRMLGRNKARILYLWFSGNFWGVFLYRLERGMSLLFGRAYKYIRIIFIPLFSLIQAYANLEIHYKADIKGGLMVLHPSLGVVISGHAVIGKNLTLTGGNVIGGKKGCRQGDIQIGDNCLLGANSTVIGPIILGNNIETGALSCVVKNCIEDGAVLIGVPAKPINKDA